MSASLSIMATGKVAAAHKKRRRRVEFLDFIRGATGSIRVRTGTAYPEPHGSRSHVLASPHQERRRARLSRARRLPFQILDSGLLIG